MQTLTDNIQTNGQRDCGEKALADPVCQHTAGKIGCGHEHDRMPEKSRSAGNVQDQTAGKSEEYSEGCAFNDGESNDCAGNGKQDKAPDGDP